MRIALTLVVFLFVVRSALATDYYIRESGSDSNNGLTPESAFASLDRFDGIAQPGDTVYIGAGTYSGPARFTTPGTATQPVRIIGDQLGQRTGDAGQVVLTNSISSEIVRLTRSSYYEFSGLRFLDGSKTITVDAAVGIVISDCRPQGRDRGHQRLGHDRGFEHAGTDQRARDHQHRFHHRGTQG
jgi:hypothetical protein